MANDDHITRLRKGVAAWNEWRFENPDIRPDFDHANLSNANLANANFVDASFVGADLTQAALYQATLQGADFTGANLSKAFALGASLSPYFSGEGTLYTNLTRANLEGAFLDLANFSEASLEEANLQRASLRLANFTKANLRRANLFDASLECATMVETDLTGANLSNSRIYGVSAWSLKLEGAKQQNLVITTKKISAELGAGGFAGLTSDEPKITVDNIEIAQFIYLMLNNQKIRDVIDSITSKAVLILGRFTDERKAVLDALREELRKHDYLPILFDFAVPATRDITETVSLLARMARFIIADLTDPSSIPKELEAIVPTLAVPVQPLLEGSSRPYAMFKDHWKYDWVLPVYRYEALEQLLPKLPEKVIAPSEAKVKALQERRRLIEAELTKPQ